MPICRDATANSVVACHSARAFTRPPHQSRGPQEPMTLPHQTLLPTIRILLPINMRIHMRMPIPICVHTYILMPKRRCIYGIRICLQPCCTALLHHHVAPPCCTTALRKALEDLLAGPLGSVSPPEPAPTPAASKPDNIGVHLSSPP